MDKTICLVSLVLVSGLVSVNSLQCYVCYDCPTPTSDQLLACGAITTPSPTTVSPTTVNPETSTTQSPSTEPATNTTLSPSEPATITTLSPSTEPATITTLSPSTEPATITTLSPSTEPATITTLSPTEPATITTLSPSTEPATNTRLSPTEPATNTTLSPTEPATNTTLSPSTEPATNTTLSSSTEPATNATESPSSGNDGSQGGRSKRSVLSSTNSKEGCNCINEANCECDETLFSNRISTYADAEYVCMKATIKGENNTDVVVRACVPSIHEGQAVCQFTNMTGCRTCNTDKCNGSFVHQYSVILLLASVGFMLLK